MGEGKGGMIWKNGIETCILPHVKRIASPGSMHETECSGLVHWDDPEGWDGQRGGRRGSEWGTHVPPWWIHVNVWQNQYNIIKLKKKTLEKNFRHRRDTSHYPEQFSHLKNSV